MPHHPHRACDTQENCKSLSENCVGSCGEGFWLWPRRRGRSIPAAGCDSRANEGHWQKTRRPEGFRGKGRLASLLLGRRPLRVSSLVAPRHPAFSSKTGLPRNFQTGSKERAELDKTALALPRSKRLQSEARCLAIGKSSRCPTAFASPTTVI